MYPEWISEPFQRCYIAHPPRDTQSIHLLAALAALCLLLVGWWLTATFKIWTQRVTFETWDPWDIWSEWCLDKKIKRQKKTKTKRQKKTFKGYCLAMLFNKRQFVESSLWSIHHISFLRAVSQLRARIRWKAEIYFSCTNYQGNQDRIYPPANKGGKGKVKRCGGSFPLSPPPQFFSSPMSSSSTRFPFSKYKTLCISGEIHPQPYTLPPRSVGRWVGWQSFGLA